LNLFDVLLVANMHCEKKSAQHQNSLFRPVDNTHHVVDFTNNLVLKFLHNVDYLIYKM